MFNKKQQDEFAYPPEVVCTLRDLMRYEWLVQSKNLLPSHPVYSILAGRHASKLRGRGLDFEEVRPYVAGDDIRNIDWRVTARTGEAHSKVFNEEKERPTFIVLDQTSWMFFGSTRYMKSVIAAHAAALGGFYTIKRGDRTGGIIFSENGMDDIIPKRSKTQLQQYLQCAVNRNRLLPQREQIVSNTEQLNRALQRTRASVTHDYVITVISDFSAINAETREHLRSMSYHNDVILIHIYDPMDEALPDGRLLLSNGQQQIAWQNTKRKWGEKYRQNFKDMRVQLTDEFRRYRIPIVFFSTADPLEDQVSKNMAFLAHS